MDEPLYLKDVPIDDFCLWLAEHGYPVLAIKSKSELARFRMPDGGEATILINKNGTLNALGWKRVLVEKFIEESKAGLVQEQLTQRNKMVTALFVRDGRHCAYCGEELTLQTATIEHVVPKSVGGPNNEHNYVLACAYCNALAKALPVADKMRMLVEMREKRREHERQSASMDDDMLGFCLLFFLLMLMGFTAWDNLEVFMKAI